MSGTACGRVGKCNCTCSKCRAGNHCNKHAYKCHKACVKTRDAYGY